MTHPPIPPEHPAGTRDAIPPGYVPPQVFRVVIIEERVRRENPKTFQMEVSTIYCGMALEWGMTGAGMTPEDALKSVEFVIFGQALLIEEFPFTGSVPKEAPEDWQRVRTSGTHLIHAEKHYRELFGEEGCRIVSRHDIDMRLTKLRAFNNDGSHHPHLWMPKPETPPPAGVAP